MKKQLLLLLLLLFVVSSFAQNENPISWQLGLDENYPVITLPALDLAKIIAEDSINDQDKTQPWRYGVKRTLSLNVFENAEVINLANGTKIWRIAIQSKDAINLSINFDEFLLPDQSRLQFYNDSKTDNSKVFDASANRVSNTLGSWIIDGDTVIIEYFQPSSVVQMPKLHLSSIIHGYRMGKVRQFIEGGRGIEDSGDCNYDVNCSVGSDFEDKKHMVKKAVALLNLGNGKLCSAVLINNTNEDKRPFLLTANHCLEGSNPQLWSVRFNWMSPSPICGEVGVSENIQTNFTMSGAQLRASNAISDFALVELYNPIPNSWDVVFAGWDRTDEVPQYQVGIHHPNGDIMKICRDNDPLVKEIADGTDVWLIKGASAGNGNGWDLGVTETGSSGSPLFSDKGHIIGQLYAGWSACEGTENNGEFDLYGRFATSWSSGNTEGSSVRFWLDPNGSEVTKIESLQNALSIGEFEIQTQLLVYPNPADDVLNIINTQFPNLTFSLFDTLGKQIASGNLFNSENRLIMSNYDEGIYFLQLIDGDSNQSIVKKIVIRH